MQVEDIVIAGVPRISFLSGCVDYVNVVGVPEFQEDGLEGVLGGKCFRQSEELDLESAEVNIGAQGGLLDEFADGFTSASVGLLNYREGEARSEPC